MVHTDLNDLRCLKLKRKKNCNKGEMPCTKSTFKPGIDHKSFSSKKLNLYILLYLTEVLFEIELLS